MASLRYQFSDRKNPEDYSLGGEDRLDETPLVSRTKGIYAGTPAWSEFSIIYQYQWNNQINFNLGVDNIFDVHYRSFASGISAPGRNFKLGISVKF